jgi:hypothetical protein
MMLTFACCLLCNVPTGDLRFEDVSLRYFPGGPLALRHVSFHVQSCEKVRPAISGDSSFVAPPKQAPCRQRCCNVLECFTAQPADLPTDACCRSALWGAQAAARRRC